VVEVDAVVEHGAQRTYVVRRMRALVAVLLLALLGIAKVAAAQHEGDTPLPANYRGWDYLVEKLVADGVDRRQVRRTFTDPRIEPFTGLQFGLHPREPNSLYRGFTKPGSIAMARRCKAAHEDTLRTAEREHGVPASVVAAIIHIESGCGRNTGSDIVLYRLARLAMANDPANLRENIDRLTGGTRDPDIESQTRQRARYLEDTFYPEVLATFQIADRMDMDPLSLRGSGSGAFGMPQFLPRSYLSFGVDGDGNGRISLYDAEDAIPSCANYLAVHGWKPGLSRAERRRVIWHYNRSDAYIDAVLELADRLDASAVTAVKRQKTPLPSKKSAAPLQHRISHAAN
jgi:membrane-bound lytic murein transglycosylase B